MPTLSTHSRDAALRCGAEREESARSEQQSSAAQWLSLLFSSLFSPLPTRCAAVARMLALFNHSSVLSRHHSARRVGEKERQQATERAVRATTVSSHSSLSHSLPLFLLLFSLLPPSGTKHASLHMPDEPPCAPSCAFQPSNSGDFDAFSPPLAPSPSLPPFFTPFSLSISLLRSRGRM